MARVVALILLVLAVALQLRYWAGDGGVRDVARLEARVEAQAQENASLERRNDELAAEVEELREGRAALEERARSELGMIKPGETFYRVIERPDDERDQP